MVGGLHLGLRLGLRCLAPRVRLQAVVILRVVVWTAVVLEGLRVLRIGSGIGHSIVLNLRRRSRQDRQLPPRLHRRSLGPDFPCLAGAGLDRGDARAVAGFHPAGACWFLDPVSGPGLAERRSYRFSLWVAGRQAAARTVVPRVAIHEKFGFGPGTWPDGNQACRGGGQEKGPGDDRGLFGAIEGGRQIRGPRPRMPPTTRETTNRITAMMAMNFAISNDMPEMPPKPSTAATRAMMKKIMAQRSMERSSEHVDGGETSTPPCRSFHRRPTPCMLDRSVLFERRRRL